MDKRNTKLEDIKPYLTYVPDRIGNEWQFSPSLKAAKRLCATRYGIAPDGKTKLYVEFNLYEWIGGEWKQLYSSPEDATSLPWDK
jgi:hypothetical protein